VIYLIFVDTDPAARQKAVEERRTKTELQKSCSFTKLKYGDVTISKYM